MTGKPIKKHTARKRKAVDLAEAFTHIYEGAFSREALDKQALVLHGRQEPFEYL